MPRVKKNSYESVTMLLFIPPLAWFY